MKICVFCGSRRGKRPSYAALAENLGKAMGEADHVLVYGGGDVGLMGLCANACLTAGGKVRGYIPEKLLQREVGHQGLTELVITQDMFDRKSMMVDASDAFVILPGGLGTLDEFFDVMTLKQLGYHDKPIIVCDIEGMWTSLSAVVAQTVAEDFADANVEDLFEVKAQEKDILQWVKGF